MVIILKASATDYSTHSSIAAGYSPLTSLRILLSPLAISKVCRASSK